MKTKIKPSSSRLTTYVILLILSFSVQTWAQDRFDEQRPENISNNQWDTLKTAVLQSKITNSDGFLQGYAYSVSINNNLAAVGAINDKQNGSYAGAVYIFSYIAAFDSWLLDAKLLPDDGMAYQWFGTSVSLDGNRVLVGARGHYSGTGPNSMPGAAYIFELSNNTWSQTAKLSASNGLPADWFGGSVSLNGNRALIGARYAVNNNVVTGAAYVFDLTNNITNAWVETQILTATNGNVYDFFGHSVSLEGNRALVGAIGHDHNGLESTGAAYVFSLSNNSWTQTEKIVAQDHNVGDQFGSKVDLDVKYALISAPYDDNSNGIDAGGAYIFQLFNGELQQMKKLIANDGEDFDNFGYSASLDGNLAVVGSYHDDTINGQWGGSAYVYTHNENGSWWSFTQKIVPNSGAASERFGQAVSLANGKIIIGAPHTTLMNNSSGSAFIFHSTPTQVFYEKDELIANNTPENDHFGIAISISGDRALIGAYKDNQNGSGAGAAYIFDYINGAWRETMKLIANDGQASDSFGRAVSLDGDRALVGAYSDDDNGTNSGSAYIFEKSLNGKWQQTSKLLPANGLTGDLFGYSVSISGDYALVGAHGDDQFGTNSGAAYVFSLDQNALTWVETEKLKPGGLNSWDYFGFSVSINQGRALVGALFDDENPHSRPANTKDSGAAYLYDLIPGQGCNNPEPLNCTYIWQETDKLKASDAEAGARFGTAVSLLGDQALIGADHDDNTNGKDTGAAYVFKFENGVWGHVEKLLASDSSPGDRFGYSVSLANTRAIVGSWLDDDYGDASGSAHLFTNNSSNWTHTEKLTAGIETQGGNSKDYFGVAVGISDTHIMAGAHKDDGKNQPFETDRGAVYIFGQPVNNIK